MKFRQWAIGLSCMLALPFAHAAKDWTLAVSEGTSGGIDSAEVLEKYEPLGRLIEKASGHKVNIVLAREFKRLEKSMRSGAYDLVMARPSDYPGRGVRDYGYRPISTMKPDGQCYLVVRKDSPYKKVQDLKGKEARFLFPEKIAYMSKFCRAALRDSGIDLNKEKVSYLREQEAVAWGIQHGVGDVGALASYSKAGKDWEKNGGRLLYQSVPQPYFPLVASKNVTPEEITKIQAALQKMEQTEEGTRILARIGVKGFNIEGEKRLADLLKWLD